jgi:hypothetical protein
MAKAKAKAETPAPVRETVLSVCQDIALDKTAPPAARVQAARTLAEMAGLIGKVQNSAMMTGETQATEMTPEDIDRELATLAQRVKPKP